MPRGGPAPMALAAAALALAALWPGARALALDPSKPLGAYTVQVWQARDGLPGDLVRGLAQTPDHRLWAATLGGVARFDGRAWSRLEVPAPFQATVGEPVRLYVASDGAAWLTSPSRPPVRLGTEGPRAFDAATGLMAASDVRAWTESSGQLWIVTAAGVFRLSGGRFVSQAAPGLAPASVTALQGGDGGLWVGTTTGLFTLRSGTLARAPSLGAQPVSLLHRDRQGALWAAAGDRLVALPGGQSWGRAEGLPGGPISALAGDGDGNLWIGTPAGLARLREGRFALYDRADGLPDDDVTSLLVDREETLWVGTRRGGIAQFTDRTLTTLPLPGLADGALEAVCEADDGALWFGTRAHGVVRWKDGQTTIRTTRDGLPANTVPAVLPAGPGAVWIGTARGLRVHRDGAFHDPGIWDRFVTGLYHDRAGTLWIAGNGELGRLQGSALKVYRPEQGMPARQLRAVAEDSQGTMWVSAVGGFVRLEGERFVTPRLTGGPPLGGVRSLLSARDGSFWFTTVSLGLGRVIGNELRLFDARSGLEPDRLSQLLEDDAGDFWIGTHNEIVRVDRASLDAVAEGRRAAVDTLAFDTTDRRAGVIAERVRQPSAWKARDGRLWFITDQGAVVIDPRRARGNPVPPVVEIESASVDGRTAAPAGRAHFPSGPGRMVLQYGAITLLQPSKVRYRHRLEGHDQAWVEAGAARTATYPALGPGSYLFRVQARNNAGVWNEQGASFAFTLAAPLYQSPWFLGGLGLVVVGLVVAGHRVRMARLRAEYVLLFSERNRMARELHDTLLQGMSAVALQLGGLRAQTRDEALQRELAGMQDTVRRCLEESRQAVWGLRERGQGRAGELGPTIERMAQRVCAAGSIGCQVQLEGNPAALPHAVEDELFRIAQEAITNAVKHAGPKQIRVRLCYDSQAVVLAISDDGAGFDPAAGDGAAGGHFGLRGMRERAARVEARLEVRSQPGQGTVVEVKVDRR